jgi:hypothetical protein
MVRYARDEIMSSSEVVRNFGALLSSVSLHKREKVAIFRNNRLEAVLLAADVYERLENASEGSGNNAGYVSSSIGDSGVLLDFLRTSRLSSPSRLSAAEIDRQILEEREAWE